MSETEKDLFTQLKETYLTETIQPYGKVVIIPTRSFQNQWKEQLEKEGVKVFSSSFGQQSCFFLRKGKQNTAEKPVKEKKKPWTPEERNKLKELLNQGLSIKEISAKLGKSVFQVGAASKHLSKLTKPQKKTANPDLDLREVLESAILLSDAGKTKGCRILLQEAIKLLE